MSPKARVKARSGRPVDELTFEEAFEELEAIVRQLEEGQLALETALAVFERGQALAARCGAQLEAAELKVQALHPKDGGYAAADFESGQEE